MTTAIVADETNTRLCAASRVTLHELTTRPEGDSWVIGRLETGDFIQASSVAHRAIALLRSGCTINETQDLIGEELGVAVDVLDFVGALLDLGFLTSVDSTLIHQSSPPKPSLPWLRPTHVRWLLHPTMGIALMIVVVAAVVAVAHDPTLVPGHDDLVWHSNGTFVLAGSAVISWSIILLHELGHLAVARAVGVPARIGFGTRLHFLVAQTDVSGVWAHPRRTRLAVYLAGMAVNLTISAIGTLALAALGPSGLLQRLLGLTVLLSLLLFAAQFMLFMRTDVYFVVQDVTRCPNLYGDAAKYILAWLRRLLRRPAPMKRRNDALDVSSSGERRIRAAYLVALVVGTTACLGTSAVITGAALAELLGAAARRVVAGESVVAVIDGVTVLLLVGGMKLLWARVWWRRHGHRIAALSRREERGGDQR